MEDKRTQLRSWEEILLALRQQGKEREADDIEMALQQGKKIRAIQLLKACGENLETG